MRKIKMFLIPYAGGSSLAYCKWKEFFNEEFELHFIELAGRGEMMNRNFYSSIDEAANDICNTIKDNIDDSDYIIFGHSMGALLAFETYYKLEEMGIRLPKHIIFSGREAPQIEQSYEKIYRYDDNKFLKKISIYGGLPVQLYDEEIKRFFVPILKADFRVLIKYKYFPKNKKIESNISVFFGQDDISIINDSIKEWSIHAGNNINFFKFKGAHFFINENIDKIAEIIKKEVED